MSRVMILPSTFSTGLHATEAPIPPAAPGAMQGSRPQEDDGWGPPSASPPAPFCLPSRELAMTDAKAMMNTDDRITSSEVVTYYVRLRPVMCKRQRVGGQFVWALEVLFGLDVTLGMEVQKTSHVKWERGSEKSVWWLAGLCWVGGYSHAGPARDRDWVCNAYVYLHDEGPRPFGRPYPQCWADQEEVHEKDCHAMRVLVGPDWLGKTYQLKLINEHEEELFNGRSFAVDFQEHRYASKNGKKERRVVVVRGLEPLRPYLQGKHDCGLRWRDGILYKLVGMYQRSTPKEYHRELMKRSWPLVCSATPPFYEHQAPSAPTTPRMSLGGEDEAQAAYGLLALQPEAAYQDADAGMSEETEDAERSEFKVDDAIVQRQSESHRAAVADAVWPLQLRRIRELLPSVPEPAAEVVIDHDDRCPAAEASMSTMNMLLFAAYHDGPIACTFVREHYIRYADMDDGFEQWCGVYARHLYPPLRQVVDGGSRAAFLDLERALREHCQVGAQLDAFYDKAPAQALEQLRVVEEAAYAA